MKTIKIVTAAELDEKLSAIPCDPQGRGWKTNFLEQHAERIEAALELHTYEQVAHAIGECGIKIAPATISNWRKQRRSQSTANSSPDNAETQRAEKPLHKRPSKLRERSSEPTASLFPAPENAVGQTTT